ncbi:MAG TPA: HPr family phosphocarrier protein [Burkholderiales bacterium]|jgi:phosphocarrier protein|nr:HPr family phosphocarrier protein [Burkholderiales bacterium]
MSDPMTMREKAALQAATGARASCAVVLTHEGGLHARPSIKVSQLAKTFGAEVRIGLSAEGPWTNAKSVSRVLALKAPIRATLYFAAEGEDAEQAVNALASLVQSDFADGTDCAK